MRSHSIMLLILLGLFAAGHVEAQSWEHPLLLAYAGYGQYSGNTCSVANTINLFDGSFEGPGPDVVYQLRNRRPVGSPLYGDTILTLVPYFSSSPPDFEIFACEQKIGAFAYNCPVEADNFVRPGQPIQVTIPTQDKTFHLIVTAANIEPDPFNSCFPYELIVQRLY